MGREELPTSPEFNQAAEDLKKFTSVSSEDLLICYGLYKQAKFGNMTPEEVKAEPGKYSFNIKEKEKWKAWNGLKDKSPEDAQKEYIEKIKALQATGGSK